MSGLAAPALVRPVWRRVRFWVAFVVVGVLAALLIGSLVDAPGRPLDPASTDRDGSKALARLIAGYGVPVTSTNSLATAQSAADREGTTVLVTSPADYSADQLRSLRAANRLVLLRPSPRVASTLLPGIDADDDAPIASEAECDLPGAEAAGDVDWPDDTVVYTAAAGTSCYGGAVIASASVVLVGSADALVNDNLGDRGLAALDVNLLTADRTAQRVVWLLPGSDAGGDGPTSIWDLFPDGAYRVFWWVVGVALLLALWRARRLGAVVTEPLPVVVRSAELVEGHGRLYERAGARDRAAELLRRSARRRLADRLGMSRLASAEQLATAASTLTGKPAAEIVRLLDGPVPADDAALMGLAEELDALVRTDAQ